MRTALALALLLIAPIAGASEFSVESFICDSYVKKVDATPPDSANAASLDAIHMWLYGYASGKADTPVMSGPAATSFVRNLYAECRANPSQSVAKASEAALLKARGGA